MVSNSFIVLNKQTGEVVYDDLKMETVESNMRKRKYREKVVSYEEFKEYQSKELGDFVFFMFNNMDKLTTILNDSELSRFVYAGTYVSNDGYLKLDNNKTYISKSKLQELLRINEKSFREFYNKLIENRLLTEHDDNLRINLDYFYKGNARYYKEMTGNELKDFTRLYIEMIRNLYENTHSRSTRRLSILYRLIPYINWRYNILCKEKDNTREQDISKIKPLTISDIVDKLGYSRSKMSRFRKDFYSLKHNDNKIFGTFQIDNEYLESVIVVNPRFLYRGNNIEDVNGILELFSLGK